MPTASSLADGLPDPSGTQAPGADPHTAVPAVLLDDANALQVGQPDLLAHIVGVADRMPEKGLLAAGFADASHSRSLLENTHSSCRSSPLSIFRRVTKGYKGTITRTPLGNGRYPAVGLPAALTKGPPNLYWAFVGG